MKMKNSELIASYNGLVELQKREKTFFEKTGQHLFQGKIKVTYAIKRNMRTLLETLEPYQDAKKELDQEYRDLQAEKDAMKKEKKQEEKRPMELQQIMQKGKSLEEYVGKMKELLDIESEVPVYAVDYKILDGMELDSMDLEALMFMLTE